MSMRPENPALISGLGRQAERRPTRRRRRPHRASVGPGSSCPRTPRCSSSISIIPIVVMIVFAFNTPSGRYNIKWEHASLDAWRNLFSFPDLSTSLKLSLEVAFLATIVRRCSDVPRSVARPVPLPRRGRGELRDLPRDRLARRSCSDDSMLTMFVNARMPAGRCADHARWRHVLHAFIAVTVRRASRGSTVPGGGGGRPGSMRSDVLQGDAAIVSASIVDGALLAFGLSMNDFVITNFVAGSATFAPVGVRRDATRPAAPGQRHRDATATFRHPHRGRATADVAGAARGRTTATRAGQARLAARFRGGRVAGAPDLRSGDGGPSTRFASRLCSRPWPPTSGTDSGRAWAPGSAIWSTMIDGILTLGLRSC